MGKKPENKENQTAWLACVKNPLIYLNMPKSACTTIKNMMYYAETGKEYHSPLDIHSNTEDLYKPLLKKEDRYWDAIARRKVAFTFVREPYSRAYSSFNEKIYHTGPHSFGKPRRCLIDEYGADFSKQGEDYTRELHAANFLKFLRFVQDTIDGVSKIKLNPHWIPQSFIVNRSRAGIPLDLIGRVENFELGMSYVLDMAGVENRMDLKVRYNEGPKPPFKFEEVINSEIYEWLDKIYKPDVRNFSYERAVEKWAR